jgi:hypothetical protein
MKDLAQVVEESDINNRELEICRILSRGNHPNICGAQASCSAPVASRARTTVRAGSRCL